MLVFLVSVAGCVGIHLLSIAITAHLVGVNIRVIAFGIGPTLLRKGIFRLGALPIAGHVKLQDSREEPVPASEMSKSLDGRSLVEQIAISLSGCAALLLVSLFLLGTAGWTAFVAGPAQLIQGAISPLFGAQTLISEGARLSATTSLATFFGYTAAKLAAFNILPLPALNGGAAIAIIGRRLRLDTWWTAGATRMLLLVLLAIVVSWCVAVLVYVTGV